MASEFLVYLQLGFEHIVDTRGYDYLLFIVVLGGTLLVDTSAGGVQRKRWTIVLSCLAALVAARLVAGSLTTWTRIGQVI